MALAWNGHRTRRRLALASGFCAWLCGFGSAALAEGPSGEKFAPLAPNNVKVGGEIGRRIDITIHNNLLVLNVEKDFLQPFRDRRSRNGGYIGLGKLMDATIRLAAYSQDPKVLALRKQLISEIIKTQQDDGYIGTFPPNLRVRTLWDLHEMVYILHALVTDYRTFDDKASLEAARKLGDYIMKHRPATAPPRDVGKLDTERAFIALADATGDNRYRDYAVNGMNLLKWNAPVGGHAYTFMNVCLAQLDLYPPAHDAALLAQSRHVFDYLTAKDGLMVSGTCSMNEAFHTNQDGRGNLGESCATAYLIRLAGRMLEIEGRPLYGDIMERAILNALFAAQSPDGRRLRYFTCQEGKRVYYNLDTYCCPGNFRRIVAELPGMVYYRGEKGVAVNLYTSSSANIALGDKLSLRIRQETDYPNSGHVVIHVDPSAAAKFPLQLRIPQWCEKPEIKVNDQPLTDAIKSDSFFVVDREWKTGDRVTLELPMPWRLVRGRKMQAGKVAVARGPQVFCLNPDRQKVKSAPAGGFAAVRLDPSSFEIVSDTTIRPDGLACRARARSAKHPATQPPDLELLLTEYADPGGQITYFPAPDGASTVEY